VETIEVDIIESDLYLTKDGYLVYNHDSYVDETCNVNGDITFDEVKTLCKDKANRHYIENMTLAEQTEIMSQISHIIRNTAHFTIYAALGFFSSFTVGQRKLFSKGSLGVVLFCFIYAVSDEIHQYFVPGRSCMFADMLIDTCGGITGMTISFLIMKIFRNGK
jgi:VanZ family protein